jgi:hypothetical protein
METKIINLTPHEVVVVGGNGEVLAKFPPSGQIARCAVTRTQTGNINGIPVSKSVMGEIQDLPGEEDDTVYIVSRVVAEAAKGMRYDLVIPDDAVRDDQGRIIGCRGFAVL